MILEDPSQLTSTFFLLFHGLLEHILQGEIPHCKRCGGLVKPTITFFGEELPPRFGQLATQVRMLLSLLVPPLLPLDYIILGPVSTCTTLSLPLPSPLSRISNIATC